MNQRYLKEGDYPINEKPTLASKDSEATLRENELMQIFEKKLMISTSETNRQQTREIYYDKEIDQTMALMQLKQIFSGFTGGYLCSLAQLDAILPVNSFDDYELSAKQLTELYQVNITP